jgi:hypothetical protein
MTDKRTLNGIDKIKNSIEEEKYNDAVLKGKTLIDNLVLSSHFSIFKRKPVRKPLFATRQAEKLLTVVNEKPELKKIIDKKTIKQTLKWYSKFKDYKSNPDSKQAKNPSKFAKKTYHLITLLNLSSIRVKSYFRK